MEAGGPGGAGWLSRDGAEDGTRTRDLLITNQLLYQLSYFGALAGRQDGIRR